MLRSSTLVLASYLYSYSNTAIGVVFSSQQLFAWAQQECRIPGHNPTSKAVGMRTRAKVFPKYSLLGTARITLHLLPTELWEI